MFRLKRLSSGLGVVAVCTILGYVCGRVRGEGDEMLLAVCFGAAGAFVELLGYGSVVSIFVALPHLFGYSQTSSPKQKSDGFGSKFKKGPDHSP